MSVVHERLLRKLREHSDLSEADAAAIRDLPYTERTVGPHEDIVQQGEKPTVSTIVVRGMVARYHTLANGRRQYLALHIAGDMPDAQSLFLRVMDHAIAALDQGSVALVPHAAVRALLVKRPVVAFAIWRETLADAAMFRAAITNNSARPLPQRLAHLFCEQYYRARAVGHASVGSCRLPLTQTQLGELLGASLPSINRALAALRQTKSVEFARGQLQVRDWERLARIGDFNPGYLHLRKPARL